jgi:hypothetical protein
MKNYILGGSLVASGLATACGIAAAVVHYNVTIDNLGQYLSYVSMLYQLAGIFGLFGIASFFIGLAFPASISETSTIGNDSTVIRNVVNN